MRPALLFPLTLLLIEFLDELVFGAQGAALPLIRDDLHLSYEQIGVLLGAPILIGNVLEPAIGVLSDVWRRKTLIVGGGICFALALLLTATARSYEMLLLGFVLFYPSSGAFVSLSQVALIDARPGRGVQTMARWNFFGALGVLAGSLALSVVARLQGDWRSLYGGFVVASVALVTLLLPHGGFGGAADSSAPAASDRRAAMRRAMDALVSGLRSRRVLRWLALLELADLTGDVLLGFVALYFVDVVRIGEPEAALAVTLLTGAWLLGSALLIPLLERVHGVSYLRFSAPLVLVLYVLLLAVPDVSLKFALLGGVGLAASGWYAVLKGQLYAEMTGHSGVTMAMASFTGMAAGLIPAALGVLAQRFGLVPVMGLLALGPLGMMVLLPGAPRRGSSLRQPQEG